MSTVRRRPAKRIKSDTGKTLCSCGCGREPARPRRTWYSDECVDRWRSINDPSYIREKVLERDRGICAVCGCDADAEYRKVSDYRKEVARMAERLIYSERFNVDWVNGKRQFRDYTRPTVKEDQEFRSYLQAKYTGVCRWTPGRTTGWDADHIIPVVEGGGECGLDNYRTLCHPCHKDATAALAARRRKHEPA